MLKFVTGDILNSEAECLVNTVNCEGYMGKGIAYQFKLQFPQNYEDYRKACKSGSLTTGKLHYYSERNKVIVNFPTKDKWRENSRIEYITSGLKELVGLLEKLQIKSVAIPPLGCGNGGLNWVEVRELIISHLSQLAEQIDVIIYEPSKYYNAKATQTPKLGLAHLILMVFKHELRVFNSLRLQKAAFFMNLFAGEEYFKFAKYKYGPYAQSISVLSKEIKEFIDFYNLPIEDAIDLAKNTLISESVEEKMRKYLPYIKKSAEFINRIPSNDEVELMGTICYIVNKNPCIGENDIVTQIREWSTEKAKKYSEQVILQGIEFLQTEGIVQRNLIGFSVVKH